MIATSNTVTPVSIFNIGTGDQRVTLTLPSGSSLDQFFNYGPTSGNTKPHRYEFDFDGETGAKINDNVITLHYTDGKRGDSDMMVDGVITAAIGGTAVITGDGDGIDDAIEDGAPNNGDGNRDGIKDKFQPHVASLKDTVSRDFVTVESAAGTTLREIASTDGSSLILQAGTENQLEGLNFIYGFLAFEVTKLVQGDAT
jgi:hypothetical protein